MKITLKREQLEAVLSTCVIPVESRRYGYRMTPDTLVIEIPESQVERPVFDTLYTQGEQHGMAYERQFSVDKIAEKDAEIERLRTQLDASWKEWMTGHSEKDKRIKELEEYIELYKGDAERCRQEMWKKAKLCRHCGHQIQPAGVPETHDLSRHP